MATPVHHAAVGDAPWPALPLAEWQDTLDTLHRWLQIVGKTRLARAPMVNHWWQVALYVTARGLTTSPIPHGTRTFQVDVDFIDHTLTVRASDGAVRTLALVPQSVADFYRRYVAMLDALDRAVHIWPVPVEIVDDATPFCDDEQHRAYDPDAAHRCWQILAQTTRVLQQFRGRFLGKCSPVHFFWGSFDLAVTRFSGRRAPPHPGGIPHLADRITREAYSHECASVGWWPGGGAVAEPAFYAYAYPEPAGYAAATVRPADAYYDTTLREHILPYAAVRSAARPDELVLEFCQSTYEAAANLAQWDREALERPSP